MNLNLLNNGLSRKEILAGPLKVPEEGGRNHLSSLRH